MLEGQSGFLAGRNTGGLIYIPREQEADGTLQQHFTHKYHLLNDGVRYKTTDKIYSMVKAGKCQIKASIKTSITSLTLFYFYKFNVVLFHRCLNVV